MIQTASANNAPRKVIDKYLKDVKLPTKDRKRIFRVLEIGVTPEGDPIIPTLKRVQGSFQVHDGIKTYQMVYASGRDADGEPIPERFRFEKTTGGMIVCGEHDLSKFTLLMMHPLNKSNPLRPNHLTPVFELVDEGVEMKEYDSKADLLMLALSTISDASDETLRNYHVFLGRDPNKDMDFIRGGLKKTAIENPKLIVDLSKSDTVDTVALINEAISKGYVKESKAKRTYTDPTTDELLHRVLPGKDMRESFAIFLKSKPELHEGYKKLLKQ